MPRKMARLDAIFAKDVDSAVRIAKSSETALIEVGSGSRAHHRPMHPTRIEYIYELAYLKMFISWEVFLELTFVRYMCGHRSPRYGLAAMKGGTSYFSRLEDAHDEIHSDLDYILWGSPKKALETIKKQIPSGRHRSVISGAKAKLNQFGAVRNRIAHGQRDAIEKFEDAAMELAKRRDFDARAGRFLGHSMLT